MRGDDTGEDAPPGGGAEGDWEYDRVVALAISSAEWIAHWSSLAVRPSGRRGGARLATCSISLSRPSERLLLSLQRLDRVYGRAGRWELQLSQPYLGHLDVVEAWCLSATDILRMHLRKEAQFVGSVTFA